MRRLKGRVVLFYRRPLSYHKSIESIFSAIQVRLSGLISVTPFVFSFYSTGILSRIRIMFQARANQGDVNHITGDVQFAAILLDKKRTILTVHDCGALHYSSGIKRAIINYFWYSLPCRRVGYLTTVSDSTKRELLKYVKVDPGKVNVIPVNISVAFFPRPRPFNVEKPVILQIGTTHNKNLDRLIESIRDIHCHLDIIGQVSTTLQGKLKAYKISWSSGLNLSEAEIVAKYVNCDLVAFVSEYEGFGMPILEAQAVGRPVITSNILSMPEVAGNAACLVDPYDISSIRLGIIKIIGDSEYRSELVERGYQNVKRFEAEWISEQYFNLYERVLNKNNILN